jgi:hypothetical protein
MTNYSERHSAGKSAENNLYILGYTEAAQLHRWSSDAVTGLVLRCSVY